MAVWVSVIVALTAIIDSCLCLTSTDLCSLVAEREAAWEERSSFSPFIAVNTACAYSNSVDLSL